MKELLEGIAIGWIIFTPKGKKIIGKIINNGIKQTKKSFLTPEILKLLDYKDLFLINEENIQDKKTSNKGDVK